MSTAFIVAVVGAESTGKTTLAQALAEHYASRGERAAFVPEYLREFCDRLGRTPQREEQTAIAQEQSRRIDEAAAAHAFVFADTTALQTAVYSEWVFGDRSLAGMAISAHRTCRLSLLTALDLPWQADGVQRDGAHVREPIDAMLRHALMAAGAAFTVVGGTGPARVQAALAAIDAARRPVTSGTGTRWRHVCALCGDADCERHLFASR
jgi:nicotinamide riboside kinase